MSRDRSTDAFARTPRAEAGHRRLRRWLAGLVLVAVVGSVAVAIGASTLRAAVAPSVSVSPASVAQLYYKPTPITITINAANLSGSGQTPVSGYQYGLQWNPAVLQWLSGPDVGPGTPTPAPIMSCLRQVSTAVTPTTVPTGFVPTYTPTSTDTPTPSNTPSAGTPTVTRTPTLSPTPTATPGGYIQVSCASLSNATPSAAGVIGTYKFLPLATAPASSPLNLINVKLLNFFATPVVPGPVITGGSVNLVACHDVNGDGKVTLSDLIIVAAHYGAVLGGPNYVPLYDVNSDGRINLTDLIILAAAYGLIC